MTDPRGEREDAERNRAFWDATADEYQATQGIQLDEHGAAWGVWQIPEDELHILGDPRGRDILELGCGAAQFSIELARRGARPIGLDVSHRQLEYAAIRMDRAGVAFALIHASAESVSLPDASVDVIFGDHGAMVFVDPYRWVPEAARLLRGGGVLAFSTFTPLAEVCWPAGSEHPVDRLVRAYVDLHRVDLGHGDHVEYQLPYGAWIRLLTTHGFVVEDLIELRPGPAATSTYQGEPGRRWGSQWPLEHVWKASRRR